ncbi:hypothetical protein HanOQP8_Chr13g0472551 [Helianthus annuus]|nr:hypothetical protein HanOQP8_Chr13g0472551 [Helianthus annuus]
MCTRGCLLRMKYTGDIFVRQINKANLPLRYKFLLYVLIQCLRKSRAGYDRAGNDLVGLMVALILNKPFSISQFIFINKKDNLRRTGTRTSGNKFWMYPRFMQIIMNVQHPDLPKATNDILKIDAMLENSLWIFKGFSAKRYKESDPPRKMFGALLNKAYVAPAIDKWRHDDSQSDDEEPELEKMMKEKFKRKRDSSDSSDSDDDEDGDGDSGDAGAIAASAPGDSSAGGDEQADSEKDTDYVPSDTETERLQKKKMVVLHKKKARKNIGTSSSAQQSIPKEPIQEAAMDPNLGFTAEEASTMVPSPPRSTEPPTAATQPPLVVTSALETPTVTPQAAPQRSMASVIRATTSQPSSERQRIFSEMSQDEKNNFLFSQLEAAADRIQRQTDFIRITKNDQLSQLVEVNTLKSTVEQQQTVIGRQQAEIDQLKAENDRLKVADHARGQSIVKSRHGTTVEIKLLLMELRL